MTSRLLFPQSEVPNPYPHYAQLLAQSPVHTDASGLRAVLSHAACTRVLEAGSAHVPALAAPEPPLSPQAALLARLLVRLANPPMHAGLREALMRLYALHRPKPVAHMLERLLSEAANANGTRGECDWMSAVASVLPARALLEGFGMEEATIARLLAHMHGLTRLMLPVKSAQQVAQADAAVAQAWPLAHAWVRQAMPAEEESGVEFATAGLLGLLIQSADAGRGLLGNALLQALRMPHAKDNHGCDWHALVTETLRFDPPIQNTRRVLSEDIELDGHRLARGDTVLVLLAAANRDPAVFADPARFDPSRANNDDHLTFGAGMHHCVARRFAVDLAADALACLFSERRVRLLDNEVRYEPLMNARVPCSLRIALA